MGDFLSFKRMITPILIQVVFWLAVIFIILGGLLMIVLGVLQLGRDATGGAVTMIGGLALMVFGPLVARIYAEILIVIFRMNETLTDISRSTAATEHTAPKPA